jgi:L-alanine-DL-glutamate epimerase-like enolase superfamily enzyme
MLLNWQTFTIHKRVPLTISRGTTSENTNIWLKISEENIEGWGEASPFDITSEEKKPDKILQELNLIAPLLQSFHPCQRQEIEKILWQNQISSATRAAIDTALHDWLGKKANLPLWQIFGLESLFNSAGFCYYRFKFSRKCAEKAVRLARNRRF